MRLLWRLRSPFSGQTNECYLINHSPVSSELQFVQIPASLTLISSSRYIGVEAAAEAAALLATALRADGFTTDVV